MDSDEHALLELQSEFLASGKASAAVVKKNNRASTLSVQPEDLKIKENIPGRRVALDLQAEPTQINGSPAFVGGMIKDIVERTQDSPDLEVPTPSIKSALKPKKINWRDRNPEKNGSRFAAQRRAAQVERPEDTPVTNMDTLHKHIDEENKKKLASMSEAELLAERQELMSTLDPALLAVFRRHTKSVENQIPPTVPDFGPQFTSEVVSSIPVVTSRNSPRAEKIENSRAQNVLRDLENARIERSAQEFTSEAEAMQDPNDFDHVHTEDCLHPIVREAPGLSIHFPEGVSADLDANSETFLTDLKHKYFPTLQHDPSLLAWMRNPTEAEDIADYHESNTSLMPAQIRFDFQGNFLAPRTSREVQSDLGLHHHADAPLAAGYTVPELAHLSRSSFPTQACMAIQTVGRVMYKIGKGFYGGEISAKLRHLIEKSMVEQTLLERSNDKHLSIRSYATEALWQANLGREGQIIEGQ